MAPIPKPRKLLCVGLNYRDHAAETVRRFRCADDFQQVRHGGDWSGDDIVLRSFEVADYEAEFAFVIGRGGGTLQGRLAGPCLGYTIVNDVSARDYQRATTQWLMGRRSIRLRRWAWIVTRMRLPIRTM